MSHQQDETSNEMLREVNRIFFRDSHSGEILKQNTHTHKIRRRNERKKLIKIVASAT